MCGKGDRIMRNKIVMRPARRRACKRADENQKHRDDRGANLIVCFDGRLDQNRADYQWKQKEDRCDSCRCDPDQKTEGERAQFSRCSVPAHEPPHDEPEDENDQSRWHEDYGIGLRRNKKRPSHRRHDSGVLRHAGADSTKKPN